MAMFFVRVSSLTFFKSKTKREEVTYQFGTIAALSIRPPDVKSFVMARPQCLSHEITTRLVTVSKTTLPFPAWRWARRFGINLSRPVCKFRIVVLQFWYHLEKQHNAFDLIDGCIILFITLESIPLSNAIK